jgi:signal transduction histidine kinase
VRFAVHDSGPGVAPDSQARLFDAFFSTKPDGLGMGLAIARSIVENHGGRLWLDPTARPGACFAFTLPDA